MAFSELSQEMREILEAITPIFEENLKRAFRNQGVRFDDMEDDVKARTHDLDDVLLTVDKTIVEMRNLRLLWMPDFRINRMSVDFYGLYLDVSFNLGDLRVEGDYETNNKTLQQLLPISHTGKVEFVLEKVIAAGKVGLYIREDSFVIANYDMKYEVGGVTVRVNNGDAENEISENNVDATLVKTFWNQLTETLTDLLHLQLGAVIVEFSVTELFADNDEEFREYAERKASKANRILDTLLRSAKDHLVGENSRKIETPPFEAIFRRKSSGGDLGILEAEEGYVQDLSTLTRRNDMSFFEDEDRAVVYGNVRMKNFKHGYGSYRIRWPQGDAAGDIRATVYQNRIFLKMEITKNRNDGGCSFVLEGVQVGAIRDIDMDVSGLASLTWLTESIGSWIVGNLRNQALPVLEKRISEAFEKAMQNVDCALLLGS